MRLSLLYNPLQLIERLGISISRKKRLDKLKNTPGETLKLGHIDSLELLELVAHDERIDPDKPIIYDIGSNVGHWTLLAKSVFKNAEIHAFEPLSTHNLQYRENCKNLSDIHLHEFCAGSANETAIINISSYSDSSSLLDATSLEFEHYQIKKQAEEQVAVKKLADLITDKTLPVPDVIKLDIQGFELEALKGLGRWLADVKYIICEVSFVPYYVNQPLFLEIANYLAEFNFNMEAFGNNTPLGAPLRQIDVLFKNT